MMVIDSRRRTFLTVTALSAAAVVLAGCGGSAGESTPGTPATDGGETAAASEITVGVLSSPTFEPCVALMAEKFEEETGTRVRQDVMAFSAMRDSYLTGFAAGVSPYDLIHVDFKWIGEFAESEFIEDLTDKASDLDAVTQVLVDSYTYQDRLYGIPYQAGSTQMFYRADVLDALGREVPKSWDEAESLAEAVLADPQFDDIYPMSVMGSPDQQTANFLNRYFNMGGGEVQDADGNPTLDRDVTIEALEALKKHLTVYSPPGALNASLADTPAQFLGGTVAMLESFSTRPGTSFDEEGLDYVAGTMPGGTTELGGWGFSIPSASEAKDTALAFAEFVSRPDNDLECTLEFGKLPVNADNFTNDEAVDLLSFLPAAGEAVENAGYRFLGADGSEYVQITNDYVSRHNAGEFSSAADAADQMIAALEAVN